MVPPQKASPARPAKAPASSSPPESVIFLFFMSLEIAQLMYLFMACLTH